MNTYFTTITNLLNTLADRGYPAQLFPCLDGWKLVFPWANDADIACNSATGGCLESYGFPWDQGDITCDTAETFCHRLAKLWDLVTYGKPDDQMKNIW